MELINGRAGNQTHSSVIANPMFLPSLEILLPLLHSKMKKRDKPLRYLGRSTVLFPFLLLER